MRGTNWRQARESLLETSPEMPQMVCARLLNQDWPLVSLKPWKRLDSNKREAAGALFVKFYCLLAGTASIFRCATFCATCGNRQTRE
jgi:hypothetical protein